MNIWMFNHHAVTPDQPCGTRHYDFAQELSQRGHSVTIFASSFNHLLHKEMRHYHGRTAILEKVNGLNFVWLRTPPYTKNNWRRVANMLVYFWRAFRVPNKMSLQKPDLIIGSSVHLLAVLSAYFLAKRYKTPFIMEIRDLWPQTLIDMGIPRWHPFIMAMKQLEKFLYKKADKIITLLPKAADYIVSLGIDANKIYWISNGVDMQRFDRECFVPSRLPQETFSVLYAGAVGKANNLDVLLDAAMEFRENKSIRFYIVGDGPEKTRLATRAKELDLDNLLFEKPVPKNEISSKLSSASCLFFNLQDTPVFKYGISSNKLFDYLAAGRPVIFSCNATNNPVEDAGAGITISPDDSQLLVKAILEIYNMSKHERNEMGNRGRGFVRKHFSIPVLTDTMEQLLKQALEKKQQLIKANSLPMFIKRLLDICVSGASLIIFTPLLLTLAVLVRVSNGSLVLFRHVRPGLHEKPFVLYKFRTMTDKSDAVGDLLPDCERLTPLGRFLRSTSLDEIPELFNVLKGDMSLVGPRPLLMEYLDRYTQEQARRHEIRPGITGYAQINGRQDIPFSKRLEYDVWYVDNRSLLLDLKILLLTVMRVFKREGVRPGQDVIEVDDIGLSSPKYSKKKD